MGWIENFEEDILPGIKEYTDENSPVFTASDLEPYVEGYNSNIISRTLSSALDDTESCLVQVDDNPNKWKAIGSELEDRIEKDNSSESKILEEAYEKIKREGEVKHEALINFMIERIDSKSLETQIEKASGMVYQLRDNYEVQGGPNQRYTTT